MNSRCSCPCHSQPAAQWVWASEELVGFGCQGAGLDEEDATTGLLSHKRKRRKWEEADEEVEPDENEEKDAERERDQREKQEFEERLRARDEAKTRKIAEAKLSKEELEVCSCYLRLFRCFSSFFSEFREGWVSCWFLDCTMITLHLFPGILCLLRAVNGSLS